MTTVNAKRPADTERDARPLLSLLTTETITRPAGVLEALDVHARIVAAREELAQGEDLTADSLLRDLEDDLFRLEREAGCAA